MRLKFRQARVCVMLPIVARRCGGRKAPGLGYGRAVLKRLAALALGLAGLPAAARAGEAPCWFDGGVVVVAASVAGVAGDYILDTGSPATLLDETRAQGAGF